MEEVRRGMGPSLRIDRHGRVVDAEGVSTAPAPRKDLPLGLGKTTTRRRVLKAGGAMSLSIAAASLLRFMVKEGMVSAQAEVITANAKGVLIADPNRCTACRRCELACTEFNKAKSQPAISNIKVVRNLQMGPRTAVYQPDVAMGTFGNHRVVQDTCKQCPHPVPCATACPNGAIIADAKTGARVVDEAQCKGCATCMTACPWQMMSFDFDKGNATKCTLCDGSPQCAEACPTGAIQYVPWRDVRGNAPKRAAGADMTMTAEKCGSCHQVR